MKFFVKEITGRLLLIGLSIASFFLFWWLPIIVAPLFWQIWDVRFHKGSRIYEIGLKLIADVFTYIVDIGYMASCIILFGTQLGHWYGWTIGVAIAVLVGWVIGLLLPYRWHLERIEGRL